MEQGKMVDKYDSVVIRFSLLDVENGEEIDGENDGEDDGEEIDGEENGKDHGEDVGEDNNRDRFDDGQI